MSRAVRSAGRVGWIVVAASLAVGGGLAASGSQPAGVEPGGYGSEAPEWAAGFGGASHFSEPSLSATMGFDVPTSIREVLVRGGQVMREGDLLMRGDDAEELALYETQKLQTQKDLDVLRAKKVHELRKVEYESTKQASERGGASALEVDEARVSMEVAEVEVWLQEMAFKQAKAQLDRYKARLDRLRLYAPFDGIIDEVLVEVGDGISEGQPALRIVNIDRLRSDVPVPTELTMQLGLEPGDPVWVLVDAPGEKKVYVGEVTEVSPRTLYATQQRRVRIEFPNPRRHPAGLAIWVRFTEPEGEWRERIVRVDDGKGPATRPDERVEAALAGTER